MSRLAAAAFSLPTQSIGGRKTHWRASRIGAIAQLPAASRPCQLYGHLHKQQQAFPPWLAANCGSHWCPHPHPQPICSIHAIGHPHPLAISSRIQFSPIKGNCAGKRQLREKRPICIIIIIITSLLPHCTAPYSRCSSPVPFSCHCQHLRHQQQQRIIASHGFQQKQPIPFLCLALLLLQSVLFS